MDSLPLRAGEVLHAPKSWGGEYEVESPDLPSSPENDEDPRMRFEVLGSDDGGFASGIPGPVGSASSGRGADVGLN
jgi:hypothetical protein